MNDAGTLQELAMAITVIYHGHSNAEIHAGNFRIQLDPFYTSNPLADIKADKPNPTHILVSHAHVDHCEDAVAIAKRTGAVLASNFEMSNYFDAKGVPATQAVNHGGGVNFPFGRATYVHAFHTSSFADGTYGGQPGGWVIEIPPAVSGLAAAKTIYFAGDTGLFGDMKLIGELWSIDLSFLPIGDVFTMGPAHALKAAQFLRTKRVIPIHYNTWPPITQDAEKFCADLNQIGVEGFPLKAGMSINL
jgi:L-ascorbate metabolism protein UlaG (beta-lactamase superfamily)